MSRQMDPTEIDEKPVVVYTLPEDINRLHLRKSEDHMILIPTQSGSTFESMHDKVIKINILEDIAGLLQDSPSDIEIRFPIDPNQELEIDQIVEYKSENIRIGVLSYVYRRSDGILIIQAIFVK